VKYKLQLLQGRKKPIVLDKLKSAEEAINNGAAYLGLTHKDYSFEQSVKYLLTKGELEFTVGRAGKQPETILIEVVL
tara:strand:- start:726 stop:956 length:231 start_codon:yes stop_codon:yes gene_type:complete